MHFFWRISEKHWIFRPLAIIGNWLEDWGLYHGHIQFNAEIMARLKAHRNNKEK
jgi:hypothetical protein